MVIKSIKRPGLEQTKQNIILFMYFHVHQDKQCSMCGALNQTEIVERGNRIWLVGFVQTFIRCTKCGHEKEIYTTASSSTGGPVNYTIEPTDPKQLF